MAGEVDFYQIYFKESQLPDLYPFAKPFLNEKLTVFFENSVIRTIVLRSEAQKIGVCSYSLKKKIGHGVPLKAEFTESALLADYDVLSLGRKQPEHKMLFRMENWHPGSRETLEKIFEYLGYPKPIEPKDSIYQNHFVARAEIYKEYVTTFLIPAMFVMVEVPEIAKRCMEDSLYYRLKTEPGYPKLIKERLGMDYVPMHPFLLERCFSLWINPHRLKVKYINEVV